MRKSTYRFYSQYKEIVFSYGELVDSIMPGDRVAITGIYRAGSIRVNHNRRNVKSVYRTHIDAIHFRKNEK